MTRLDNYQFLFDIAMILLSTKILGLLTRRIHMPQVVGALAAGLIMGPACLGILTENDFIKLTEELGVIVLMFCAGMQTDIDELKKSGKASFIIALIGVIVPLLGGFLLAWFFNRPESRFASDERHNDSIFCAACPGRHSDQGHRMRTGRQALPL